MRQDFQRVVTVLSCNGCGKTGAKGPNHARLLKRLKDENWLIQDPYDRNKASHECPTCVQARIMGDQLGG